VAADSAGAAVAGAGAASLGGLATVPAAVVLTVAAVRAIVPLTLLVTVPLTVLVTAGTTLADVAVAGAGTWFAAALDPGGGTGTLAAGAAGEEAALVAGAWLAARGWPAELGWPAAAGWAGGCGAGGGAAEDGPGLPLPGAGVLPGPGRRLWAAPATEPATEVTLPTGRPAVSPLTPAAAAEPGGCPEPGFCVEAGFWSADARPARSTAKTSAAAKPPHAYRQTLTTSSNARERVADPSTANTLPPDPGNYPYFPDRRTAPDLLCCPGKGRLPA